MLNKVTFFTFHQIDTIAFSAFNYIVTAKTNIISWPMKAGSSQYTSLKNGNDEIQSRDMKKKLLPILQGTVMVNIIPDISYSKYSCGNFHLGNPFGHI